jgi:hypothetical protein
MSVFARSRRSAGRPIFGRPAAAVVALIATFAVGAPTAVADESPVPTDPVSDVAAAPSPEPVVPDVPAPEPVPPPVDPPETETPPVDPPETETPPVDPPPAEPPAAPAPAEPAPSASEPSSPPAETQSAPEAATPPPAADDEPPDSGEQRAVAENVSRVIQVVWQVQQGCRSHCHGTSQTQRSVQWSETTQSATAIAGGSTAGGESSTAVSGNGDANAGGSTAGARNESSTVQFVWQMQIGCVAFCYETSQTQEASQHSVTDQEAIARSALTSWAENLATTIQYVFQEQRGCEHECHGTSQSQSVSQEQWTSQSATADSELPGDGDGGVFRLPEWLIAYARNIGATIQEVHQYQEATCVEHCWGGAQVQEVVQSATTRQEAVAMAPPPPEDPPVEQPPAEEPPGQGPAPEAETYTPPVVTGQATTSLGTAFIVDRTRGRTVRRQELVFRLTRRSRDNGSTPPNGPGLTGLTSAGQGFGDAASAAGPADLTASGRKASDRSGAVAGKTAEQRPARTLTVPFGDSSGDSNGWMLILLIAAALGFFIGFYRKELAPGLNRI